MENRKHNRYLIFLVLICVWLWLTSCAPTVVEEYVVDHPVKNLRLDDDGEYHYLVVRNGSVRQFSDMNTMVKVSYDDIPSPVLRQHMKKVYYNDPSVLTTQKVDSYIRIVLPLDYEIQTIVD
jgi:hypothetical protein